jgi:hypothetical protein
VSTFTPTGAPGDALQLAGASDGSFDMTPADLNDCGTQRYIAELTGDVRLKQRVQHPNVIERKDRGQHYWYFRCREDEMLPSGKIKSVESFTLSGQAEAKAASRRGRPKSSATNSYWNGTRLRADAKPSSR